MINSLVSRQLARINASVVALYACARLSKVSPACILIGDHPDGGGQLAGGGGVSEGGGVAEGNIVVNGIAIEGVKNGTVLVSPGSFVAVSTVRVIIENRRPGVRVSVLFIASFRPLSDNDRERLPKITTAESRAARNPKITWRMFFTSCLHGLGQYQAVVAHCTLRHAQDRNPPRCVRHGLQPVS